MKELSEAQIRYLQRIAQQMRAGYTGRIEMDVIQGGVRDFREIRSIKPLDLEPGSSEPWLQSA